jgi:hypothetical protein
VQVKLNDEVAKGVEHISASLLRASEEILARGGVVDGYGTIVLLGESVKLFRRVTIRNTHRFDILHLIASQSLARNKLGWRESMGGDLRLAPRVMIQDGVFLSRGRVNRVCGRGVRVVSHC